MVDNGKESALGFLFLFTLVGVLLYSMSEYSNKMESKLAELEAQELTAELSVEETVKMLESEEFDGSVALLDYMRKSQLLASSAVSDKRSASKATLNSLERKIKLLNSAVEFADEKYSKLKVTSEGDKE